MKSMCKDSMKFAIKNMNRNSIEIGTKSLYEDLIKFNDKKI